MTPHEIFLCKTALRVLDSAGPQGVSREAWMEQVGICAQAPLTSAEQAALISKCEGNGWVLSYRDPIREQVRWVLSGPGTLALGVL